MIDSVLRDHLLALRRDLHRHPELSWQEHRTADRVCEELDRIGVAYDRGVAGTGVVGHIPGPSGVPAIALRADMDALPVTEETGLPFASETEGVMHACGHDAHTAMVIGAAELLARGEPLATPVRLVFQPAEETGAGARAMIEAGVLDGVAQIFGGHVDRHYSTGTIVTHAGAVNASTDSFTIEIRGQGGHAARPHEGTDAVVIGALLVMSIQTIVSREINPAHPSVVTVGRFDAGTASNVIAGRACLAGTVRAQDPAVRDHLLAALERMCQSIGQLHGAAIEIEIAEGTPALINPPEMASLAREAASLVVGAEHAVPLAVTNMGGEDFAYYLQHVPGCYVRFGAQVPGREGYPAHSSRFDVDEAVLGIGAAYFAQVARIAGGKG